MEAAAVQPIAHPAGITLAPDPTVLERRVGWIYAGTGLALFGVLGLTGLVMRASQADIVHVSPAWFYRLMTVHGAGMLVGALLAAMGALWFALHPTVPVSPQRALASFAAILVGAVAVVVATIVGGFAAGWTFLSPLPFHSAGQWSTWSTVTFLVGMVLVGLGFALYCLDLLMASTSVYGGLTRALGIDFLRDRDDDPPPPQVIAATVVAIEGLLASAAGTTILAALLGRTFDHGMTLDALWAKNLTYFFGHSVANLIIYIIVGAVYVLVPRYAGRPWKTSKPIVVGWMATLLLVATAYSHHLYMDFVQPQWADVVSTTASFAAALPVAVVTIYTAMMLVWGSRYRWTLASTLLYLGFAGWAIGGTGAVIDSVIPINFKLHNTLWVPAHFHTYLLLGVMLWAMAFFTHLLERAADRPAGRRASRLVPALLVVGGYGFVGEWYVSGALGIPRRYATHPPGTHVYSVVGTAFVVVFAVGCAVLAAEWARLGLEARRARRPLPATERAAVPAGRFRLPLADGPEVAVGVAICLVAITSLVPTIVKASERGARYHHLDHAGQFLFGSVAGLTIMSVWLLGRPARARPNATAVAVVLLAPAAMLIGMVPRIYGGLDKHAFAHLAYHVGVVALGVATGAGAAYLGRVSGRLVVFLSIAMAAMYAGGVAGG